jgi:HK97 family phage major capsid protein
MTDEVQKQIMVETKKTHEGLMTAVADLKTEIKRGDTFETKLGNVPEDLKETLAKVDTAVEALDTKHQGLVDLMTEQKKTNDAMEQKLNDLEADEGTVASVEEKLAATHALEFKAFLCGDESPEMKTKLADLQLKSMYAGSDPDGGFVIPRPMSNMIQTAKRDATPFRENSGVTSIGGDTFKYLIDIGEAAAGWVTERAARGKTNTPQLQEANITVNEMYAGPALTQTILEDATFPLESWLGGKISDAFSDLEAQAFLAGNGVGKPRGILTYEDGVNWNQIEQIKSGAATTITSDQLIALQDLLKDKFANAAKFYMNRKTLTPIRQLKSDTGTGFDQYLWQPGITAGAPSTLLGDPIVKMNYMPTLAADSLSIMFGDLKQSYLIVDRSSIRVLRDPFTMHPYIVFKTNARVGGSCVNFEGIKLMKTGTVA